jgi:hypothetical protein
VIDGTAKSFAYQLAELYPRFDQARFLSACGVREED